MLDARQSVLWLALLVLACDSSAPDRETVDLSPSTVGNPADNPGDAGTASDHDAGPCAAIAESANALLETHRSCQVDQDCRDDAILAPCPASPQCSVFVRKDTDLLWSEAAKLEASYQTSCGKCAAIKCSAREVTRAFCDASKHCAGRKLPDQSGSDAGSLSPSPSADAATPSATVDAGTGTAPATDAGSTSSSAYACKVNLDCVITNVGNCCGYYPRCANVSATFVPPVCTGGQAGACGFPSIDSCECRQNTCVSLQAGNPI
jgi:hypothetical protein